MNDYYRTYFPSKLNLNNRVKRESEYCLASGSFGAIYKGRLESFDGTTSRLVAIKVPHMDIIKDPKGRGRMAREMETWSRTKHKNVQRLLGYCTDLFPHGLECFVSPWRENGTAREFIKKHPTTNRITLVKEIADGLTHLHICKIIHGDIRGANILIGPHREPLINDFGLSRYDGGISASSSHHGNLRWMPPESAAPEKFQLTMEETHAYSLDVWSFGMTILELITGQDPYAEYQHGLQLSNAISSGKPPTRPEIFVDDAMWDLCLRIWKKAREERPQMNVIFGELTRLEHAPDFPEEKMPKSSYYKHQGKTLGQIGDELFKGISLLAANANLAKDRSAQRRFFREWKRMNAARLELSTKQPKFSMSSLRKNRKRALLSMSSRKRRKKVLLGEAQKFYNDVKDFVSGRSTTEPLEGQDRDTHSQQQ